MFGETFTSFEINFDALNERNVFVCGDVISGRIIFKISKEIRVNSITVIVKGKASVAWSTGSSKHRRHHSAREEYFTMKCEDVIQQNAIGAGETVLPSGTHVYPFRFQLPLGNFPSSFQGVNGRVVYSLVVEIHRPWHLAKEFRSELNFVSHIDANHPQLLEPLSASNNKEVGCLCCTSGPVSMRVQLERKGYVPGEMIHIIADFENASSRTLVPKATLVQIQTFYTISRSTKRCIPKELAKVEGRHLMPRSSGVWGDQLLQIPAETHLTISNCQILEVDYYLLVCLKIPSGFNLKVIIPLVICSIPVYRPPS
ncbi:hypothetical protein SKAU_G00013560 [Synaphobranchus kaupii]|uniref:Arrestin C-terminal-like domain-containing protein n=1 Tax=Synaphobranchus kaupii TaxID=118154 RepID=A0A9Q1JCF3_SYNKA|nr:hypothetical protein SKAU_G00013560 [Synaphobranchus kaupii]